MHTTKKGDLAVAFLTARFLRLEYVVLKPITELSRYDLVIDRGLGFERVQCKAGRIRHGAVVFNTSSSHYHMGGRRKSYLGEVELFGVYCPDNDSCYLVPAGAVAASEGSLRIVEPKNNQRSGIRYASEFQV